MYRYAIITKDGEVITSNKFYNSVLEMLQTEIFNDDINDIDCIDIYQGRGDLPDMKPIYTID